MSVQRFQFVSEFNRPATEIFRWHERPGALERLTPPWANLKILAEGEIKDGSRTVLQQQLGPFWSTWEVEHREIIPGKQFCDVALRGPFTSWRHTHRVAQTGSGSATLEDIIEYTLPGGVLGQKWGCAKAQTELQRLFRFRHARLHEDLEAVAPYGAVRPMRILVSGASGMIGRAIIPFLRTQGHEIIRLVRGAVSRPDEVSWDPMAGKLDEHALKAIDAVVHLAGATVARRWTKTAREEIWRSRVSATRTLVDAIERMRHRPFVFVSASATGFYGSRGGEMVDETSSRGEGFLAELCEAWERETQEVGELGIRPVMLRTGIVLSPSGGILQRLLPSFRCGLGAQLGSGDQWISWLSIDDLIGIYYHAILDQRCSGPVNAVTRDPVTNRAFTKTLSRVLSRPTVFRLPAPMLRAGLGEMANETLLSSTRAAPEKLYQAGYAFRHRDLESTLRFLLGR